MTKMEAIEAKASPEVQKAMLRLARLGLVQHLLADASRWCKRRMATRLDNGFYREAAPHADEAVQWCLAGAAQKVGWDSQELAELLGFSCVSDMTSWNDRSDRTHSQVLVRLEHAEKLLRSQIL